MALKQCGGCSIEKPHIQFYRRPRYSLYPESSAGYSTKCKDCVKKDRSKYRQDNLQKSELTNTNSRLKRVYGIDLNQYNQLLKEQNGCCKGCSRPSTEFVKKLVVDHDHKNGKVKGLLCTPCNLILGYAQDKIFVLTNLIKYLQFSNSELAVITNVMSQETLKKVG